VNVYELQAAFGATSLPGISYPLLMSDVETDLPEACKAYDVNKKQGIITAYLTVYRNDDGTPFVDPYKDIIAPGSFTKTIQELDAARNRKHNPWLIPNLWQHDRYQIIGGVKALSEDSKGIIYETHLCMGVKQAQEALELADKKMIGSSYGYDPLRFTMLPGDIRELKEIKLREISQVTFPANDIAPIIGTKQYAFNGTARATQIVAQVFPMKARDFSTMWAAKQPEEVLSEYYHMIDVLTRSLMETIKDQTVTDKMGSVDTTLGQFGEQLVKNWLPMWEMCQQDMASMGMGMDEMSGYHSADMSSLSLKQFSLFLVKAGKVLSSVSRKRVDDTLANLRSQCDQIQSWLDDLDGKSSHSSSENTHIDTQRTPKFLASSDESLNGASSPELSPNEVSLDTFKQAVRGVFGDIHYASNIARI